MLLNSLAESINSRSQTHAIFFDFSKAFDKVSHDRLLLKLQSYGIRGQILLWIKGFLSGRTQRVLMDGEKSSSCHVLSGVPQGSVLGPILSLIVINDIVNDVSSDISLFADDCALYRRIDTLDDEETLQNDLNKLCAWSRRWNMEFNVSKCYSMTITLKRSTIQNEYQISVVLIEKVESYKY